MGSTCAHHYPHTKFHQCSPYRTLDYHFFVISQSEQICKWGIKYAYLMTKDHMGSTCAHHYHIQSFINVAHTELWIFYFFVISQSEQICKWRIKYVHSVTAAHVCSTCAPTTHIPSLTKISHCILIRERRFTFWCWRETYICTYIHLYRQRDNWNLSVPSSIAGGPHERQWSRSSCYNIQRIALPDTIYPPVHNYMQTYSILIAACESKMQQQVKMLVNWEKFSHSWAFN